MENAKVPLLRIVPIQKGPIVTTSYNQVFSYPVMRKIFGAVEINIKGDTGEIILFVSGKSFVTPHFHRKRSTRITAGDNSTHQAYEQYYTSQAGSGLPGIQGLQYQRGHSLRSLFRELIGVSTPLLKKGAIALGKSLGQKALKAGVELAQGHLGGNKRNSNQKIVSF